MSLHSDGLTRHDSQVVDEVLHTPKSPLAVTADKAYDRQKVRQQIKHEGALPAIPNRINAAKKAYCPKRFYRRRNKIENFFYRIKVWRRIATRCDKLTRNFLATADLVGALYWINLCVQSLIGDEFSINFTPADQRTTIYTSFICSASNLFKVKTLRLGFRLRGNQNSMIFALPWQGNADAIF